MADQTLDDRSELLVSNFDGTEYSEALQGSLGYSFKTKIGTAIAADTGTAAGDVPTNADLAGAITENELADSAVTYTKIATSALESIVDLIYPVGSLQTHADDFVGATLASLDDRWKLCDGSLVDDIASDYDDVRVYNLTGDNVVLTLTWTADAGGSYATVDAADRYAVNIGDWIAGTGIDAGGMVTEFVHATGVVTITQVDLTGVVAVTLSNDGVSLTGGVSDKLSHADQMQGHQHLSPAYLLSSQAGEAYKASLADNNDDLGVYTGRLAVTSGNTNKPQVARTDEYRTDETNGEPRTGLRTKPHARRMPIYIRIK